MIAPRRVCATITCQEPKRAKDMRVGLEHKKNRPFRAVQNIEFFVVVPAPCCSRVSLLP